MLGSYITNNKIFLGPKPKLVVVPGTGKSHWEEIKSAIMDIIRNADLADQTESNMRSVIRATIAPGYLALKNHGRADKVTELNKEEELALPTIENLGYKSMFLNRRQGTENEEQLVELLCFCCGIAVINMAESFKSDVEGMDSELEVPILEAVNLALDRYGNEVLLTTQMYKVGTRKLTKVLESRERPEETLVNLTKDWENEQEMPLDTRKAFRSRRRSKKKSQGREIVFASKPESIAGTEVESVICLIDSCVRHHLFICRHID